MAERSSSNQTTPLPGPALIPLGSHEGKPPILLNRPVTLVGSRHNCHLHLLSRQISKAHAAILRTENGVIVRDLASRTHVLVNGLPVHEATLNTGDELQIGPFKFQFRVPAGTRYPAAHTLPGVLVDVEGGDFPIVMPLRTLLIGRKPESDIPLVEASASTCHALIFEMDGKRWVRDLGSRTGTWVNGRQVKTTELGVGDQLKIGETTMRLVLADPPVAPAEPLVHEGASDNSVVAGHTDLTNAFARGASATDEEDEFEAFVGTAPLEPEEPIPAQANEPETSSETAEVDLSIVDLDAEMNSPADTAHLPAESEEKRKRPATPRLAESVEDHVDIDDQDQRMLVDGAIMREKLSSSATHTDLGMAAAEAIELAGKPDAAQSLAVSSAEVLAEEPIDKVAPPASLTPVAAPAPVAPPAKEPEFSPRGGWRKRKAPPEPEVVPVAEAPAPIAEAPTPVAPIVPAPAVVVAKAEPPAPVVVPPVIAKAEVPAPVEAAPVEPVSIEPAPEEPASIEPESVEPPIQLLTEVELPPAREVGEARLSPSVLGNLPIEPVFDELELTSEEEDVPARMEFDVQVPREPDPPKKQSAVKPEKIAPPVEPEEFDLSGLNFEDSAPPEIIEPVEQGPITDIDEEEPASTSAPAPLVNLGVRQLEIPLEPSVPARSNRRPFADEAPVAEPIPAAESPAPAPSKTVSVSIAEVPIVASPAAAVPAPVAVVPAPVVIAPVVEAAVSEVISETEPSPEAAQALERVVLAEPQATVAEAEPASLTDTSFGRAVEEFVGDSLGPIVEPKPEPIAPAPTPVIVPPAPVAAPVLPVAAPVTPVVIKPVVAAPRPEPEPEAEPEPIFAKAPAAKVSDEPKIQPPIDAELLAEEPGFAERPLESVLPAEQENAALDELLQGSDAPAVQDAGAPMFNLIGQPRSEADDAVEEEYETDESEAGQPVGESDQEGESGEQEDEEAQTPIFRNPAIRLPAPVPRGPQQVSASSLEPEAVAAPVNLSRAAEETSLDDILAWGTPGNYMAGLQLNLPELPAAPEHFGKVGVSFGEAELRVDSNTRAPFEIVQPKRRAIEEQQTPVFQVQPQAPKQKVIRPLSDKSRRPRPIRGVTQRRPKAAGSQPIGMPEPVQEPEAILDPTIGSFSPVFGATLPESFGEGATVFGGLSMSPVREVDVFSQMSRSTIPIDPFTGATPDDIMQEAARPQQKPGRNRGVLQPPTRRPPNIGPARKAPAAQAAAVGFPPIPAEGLTPALGAEDHPVDVSAAEQVLSGAPAPAAKAESGTGTRQGRAAIVPKGLPPRVDPATRGPAGAAGGQPAYPVMKKRRRWLSTPWLILAMLMTTAVASVATFMFSPVRYLVSGEMQYLHLDHLNHTQRNEFFNISYMGNLPQRRVLEQAYQAAAQRVQFEGISPGFLSDPAQYLRTLNSPDALTWPVDNGDTMQFATWTTDRDGDAARIKAVLTELYLANTHQSGGDIESAITSLKDQIAQEQTEIDHLDRQIADADAIVAAGVTPEQLAQLDKDRDAADRVHADAYAMLIEAQQELDRARQDALATQTPDTAATTEPAAADDATEDPQLADAEKRLAVYSRRYDAAKKYSADEAERNRKALEASIDEFKSNMADVQQLVKDNPSLQQYLVSAQKLQDYVQKISGDMLDREQRDVDNLLDLKRFVDEQIERQRNDRYDNDKELGDLRVQLASIQRQANAASEQGYTKEATDKAAEVKDLQDKIDARKAELAKEPALTSASQRLTDQIALQQKQLVSDRDDNDKAMKQLEQDMAQNAPAVSNLPKDQQQVAEKMSRDVDAMNNARKIYSESLAARDEETNEDLKTLQQTVQKYAAEVDDRKKELALASDHKLTDEQQQERQAAVAQKQSDYDTAKAAEEAALTDSGTKYLAAARAALTANNAKNAAPTAEAARIERGEKQADLEAKKSALATKQGDLDKVVSAKEPEMKLGGSTDTRALYTMAVGFSVIALFSMVIVGNHLAQARHPQAREPAAPAAVDPDSTLEPDPSLAGATPDPVFGGGSTSRDLHALEADGDEDVDPIVA